MKFSELKDSLKENLAPKNVLYDVKLQLILLLTFFILPILLVILVAIFF